MRITPAVFGLAAAVSCFGAEQLSAATADQAGAIKASLERYLGKGAGGTSPVTVTPTGESYKVEIDAKKVLSGLEPFGVTLDPLTYSFSLLPQEGGLWQVSNAALPVVGAKVGDRAFSLAINGMRSEGLFDPSIPSFTRSSTTYDSMSIAAFGGKGGTQTREQTNGKQEVTATVTGDGVVDFKGSQTSASASQDVSLDIAASGGTPGRVSIKTGASAGMAQIDALHIRALTDLWAFLVAHPSKASLIASQDDFRTLLRRALPLFKHLDQGGSMEHVGVESPAGNFGVDALSGRIAMNGLAEPGMVEAELKIAGLAIPDALLPPWTAGLLPTLIEFKQSLTGFSVDTAVQTAIADFDLAAPEPYTPEQKAKLAAAVGSPAQMVVKVLPSRIATPLVELQLDGEARLVQPVPEFTFNIKATGIDAAVQSIQAKAGKDKVAGQLIASLLLAKGFAKTAPDGTLSWVVANSGGNGITVNGVALPTGAAP